ncbi:MAG: ribosome silencing factor [Syntrophobacteraceae bacterium]
MKKGIEAVKGKPGTEQKESIDSRNKAILMARKAVNFKALDLVLLDVSDFSSFADYFVICSGKSSRQVQGLADNIESSLRDQRIKPLGVEGRQEGHWILMDYGDVIVHIFYEPVRYFYDLESLWSEAEKVHLEHEQEREIFNPTTV